MSSSAHTFIKMVLRSNDPKNRYYHDNFIERVKRFLSVTWCKPRGELKKGQQNKPIRQWRDKRLHVVCKTYKHKTCEMYDE